MIIFRKQNKQKLIQSWEQIGTDSEGADPYTVGTSFGMTGYLFKQNEEENGVAVSFYIYVFSIIIVSCPIICSISSLFPLKS